MMDGWVDATEERAEPFERWYRREHPRLVSALAVVAADHLIGAEVADEAFVRAYERWDRISTMASPAGWTYKVALHALRRRQRRAAMEARLLSLRPSGLAERSGAPPADWSLEVWDALCRLPTRERTAVALRYVADLPVDAVAAAMHVAPGTVGSTLNAARRNLARVLADAPSPLRAAAPAPVEAPAHE